MEGVPAAAKRKVKKAPASEDGALDEVSEAEDDDQDVDGKAFAKAVSTESVG